MDGNSEKGGNDLAVGGDNVDMLPPISAEIEKENRLLEAIQQLDPLKRNVTFSAVKGKIMKSDFPI